MTDEKESKSKGNSWRVISGILAVLLVISIFTNGFGGSCTEEKTTENVVESKTQPIELAGSTFTATENEICTEDGKPVVRLFSTTWCPHCNWVGGTYESVVQEYVEAGKIVAKHWEIDTKDDTLTEQFEGNVPEEELDIYKEFNPRGSIPTFVFGCKYGRIGNGYERLGDEGLDMEEAEFRKIIDDLIESS